MKKSRYYRIFMYMYASTLRCASFLMVNSTWTKDHIDSILAHHDTLLDTTFGMISLLGRLSSSSVASTAEHVPPRSAKTVYPPCETQELIGFSLEGRNKIIVSVAQFR